MDRPACPATPAHSARRAHRSTSSRSRPSSPGCTRRRCARTTGWASSSPVGRPGGAAATPPATSRCSARCSASPRRRASTSRASGASSRWANQVAALQERVRELEAELERGRGPRPTSASRRRTGPTGATSSRSTGRGRHVAPTALNRRATTNSELSGKHSTLHVVVTSKATVTDSDTRHWTCDMNLDRLTTKSSRGLLGRRRERDAPSGSPQVEPLHLLAALLDQPEGLAGPLLDAVGSLRSARCARRSSRRWPASRRPAASPSRAPQLSRAARRRRSTTAEAQAAQARRRVRLHRAPAGPRWPTTAATPPAAEVRRRHARGAGRRVRPRSAAATGG